MPHEDTLDRPPRTPLAQSERRLALTILHHSDPQRVGERAAIATGDKRIALGRHEPRFERGALDDPFVSRRASEIVIDGSQVRWRRAEHGSGMIAEGVPVGDEVSFDAAALDVGVVLELSQRILLLMHWRSTEPSAEVGRYGLVGASEGIEQVRLAIDRVGDLDVPVLLRGESGTGKELVARAIHESSARKGELITVNMAAIAPTVAASELFGHVRGAFTGAVRDHSGCFRDADGGTLFLDEVGDTPADVQPMLLRTLESGEVQPVGSSRGTRVDVRLITATDVDLEAGVTAGRFRSSLLHRIAGFQIPLPALRERRDDVARLLVHFLREELERVGMQDRLQARDPEAASWLPIELVSRLVRHPWPGNVRQLRNVARQIVLASRGEAHARIDGAVELALSTAPPASPSARFAADPVRRSEPAEASAPRPVPRKRKPGEIDTAEIRAALAASGWKLGPTAERLGISRSSLYDLLDRHPDLRRARDLDRAEIEAAIGAVGKEPEALAQHLQVSPKGLKLRMKELGL